MFCEGLRTTVKMDTWENVENLPLVASEALWSLPKASETPSSPTIVFYSVRSILHAKLMKNTGKHALLTILSEKH